MAFATRPMPVKGPLYARPGRADQSHSRLDLYLAEHHHPTPFLVVDLDKVAERYRVDVLSASA